MGSLQSLSMKEYDKGTFDEFGLVICDEVHNFAAEVFSRALQKINCKHSLGLSATITRKDGLSKVFKWHLGDIVFKNRKKHNVIVKDIDDISKSIMADSVVFLSHSSFDNNILKSDKINHAILCDPITNPDLGFEGLKQEPIDNNYPCLIIRAEKAYSTKVPIPNFLNPNLKGEIEDITYNDVGHIDILDDFWADFATDSV